MKLGKLLRQRSENKIRDSTGNIMLCVCSLSTTRFLVTSSSFTVEIPRLLLLYRKFLLTLSLMPLEATKIYQMSAQFVIFPLGFYIAINRISSGFEGPIANNFRS